MAIVFQKNVRNSFLNGGTILGLTYAAATANPFDNLSGNSVAVCVTFWGGVQPSAADLATNWISTYKTTALLHLVNFQIIQSNAKVANTGITVSNSGLPTAAAALNSGTVTWAVIWPSSFAASNISAVTSLPASYPKHIITPVSDVAGSYPLRMANTVLVAGTSYSITDFSLTAAGGLS